MQFQNVVAFLDGDQDDFSFLLNFTLCEKMMTLYDAKVSHKIYQCTLDVHPAVFQ